MKELITAVNQLLIAEDDSVIKLGQPLAADRAKIALSPVPELGPERTLVLGLNQRLNTMLCPPGKSGELVTAVAEGVSWAESGFGLPSSLRMIFPWFPMQRQVLVSGTSGTVDGGTRAHWHGSPLG